MTLAAMSSSLRQRLTPTLMLGASMIGTFWAVVVIVFRSSIENPVVPITIRPPYSAQRAKALSEGSGRVKSIKKRKSRGKRKNSKAQTSW